MSIFLIALESVDPSIKANTPYVVSLAQCSGLNKDVALEDAKQ